MNNLSYSLSEHNTPTSTFPDEVIHDTDASLQALKWQLLVFISQQFSVLSSLYDSENDKEVLQRLLSKINWLRRAIITVDIHNNREWFEYIRDTISDSAYRDFVRESVIEINKDLAKLYYFTWHTPQVFIELWDIFRELEENLRPKTNVIPIESTREKRRQAVQWLIRSEIDTSTASISSIRQKREEIAKKLQNSQSQWASAEIRAMDIENQIRYNHVQPRDIDDSVANSIRKRSLEKNDPDLLEWLQHHYESKAANDPKFNQHGLSLSSHVRNLGSDKYIVVDTTYWEMRITQLTPFFPTHESIKRYYKADIEFQWKKLKVLIREDMFRVGDMSDKFLGFFDKNGKFTPWVKWASGYIIKSIQTVTQEKPKDSIWSKIANTWLWKLRSWFGKI